LGPKKKGEKNRSKLEKNHSKWKISERDENFDPPQKKDDN
jgi:hypothetical protein